MENPMINLRSDLNPSFGKLTDSQRIVMAMKMFKNNSWYSFQILDAKKDDDGKVVGYQILVSTFDLKTLNRVCDFFEILATIHPHYGFVEEENNHHNYLRVSIH